MRSSHVIKSTLPPKKRRYNVRHIKKAKTYDVKEICDLFSLHKNTVLNWVKSGLLPLDHSRPMLIYGAHLIEYLDKKQGQRKQKCGFSKLYCFKCRKPQEPMEKLADLSFKTEKVAHLAALCEACLTPMNRNIRAADIPKFEKAMRIQTLQSATLSAPLPHRVNCDFN